MAIIECTSEEAERLYNEIVAEARAARERRRRTMPTTAAALQVMTQAYERLEELGWRAAMYCPKDRSPFQAIEAGSTGVHDCHYEGKWPNGSYWISADYDLWPANPILFRPIDAADREPPELPEPTL
jgi:hypothetical protein